VAGCKPGKGMGHKGMAGAGRQFSHVAPSSCSLEPQRKVGRHGPQYVEMQAEQWIGSAD
jgi:hypothetical protein